MMKFLRPLLIILVIVISQMLLPQLPAQVPSHWNILGQVDGYMSKEWFVWFTPALSILMLIGFHFTPKLDPKKNKYQLFQPEWEIIQTGLISFFAYLHLITLYAALNPSTNFLQLMFIGFGALFVLIGNYLSKIRQNYFLGFKLPWTLANEENWNKTHRYASWWFVCVGIITIMEAFWLWYAPVIIFGGIMLASAMPCLYSYLLFIKKTQLMPVFYWIGIILAALILLLRLSSPEDAWFCQDGQWVQHGHPAQAMPTQTCPK